MILTPGGGLSEKCNDMVISLCSRELANCRTGVLHKD